MTVRRATARWLTAAATSLVAATTTLAQTPAGGPGTVTLPLAEYNTLLDRAVRPSAAPPAAPFPSLVNRADLSLRADADSLRGTITMQGDVWRTGPVKVALVRGGTLVDASAGGRPMPLVAEAGTASAILDGPAVFTATLTWATALGSEPGRALAVLPAVHAGTVHATIDLPGDNPDVKVEPGIVSSRTSAGGRTIVGVTLEPGTPGRVSWSSRDAAPKPARDVRLVSNAKTLVTIGDADLRVGTLFDVAVVQGDPDAFTVTVPDGYDVAAVAGTSVESEGVHAGTLRLAVREPSRDHHQFLVTLERPAAAGVSHDELALPALEGTQRESGEVALEAAGTVELTAPEKAPLRRLDVSEVSASLAALARTPLLSAFRYQRRDRERVLLAFDVKRFADAPVATAVAELASVTTLLTVGGQTLTEVGLTLRNRGQQFLKVGLPAGATLLSAQVGGEPVKPVEGDDGLRVPLVRPGFQPPGAYDVSFVYVGAGTPLGKKGQAALSMARMDVPVDIVQWELFVPDQYDVKRFAGDAIPQHLVGRFSFAADTGARVPPAVAAQKGVPARLANLMVSEVGGIVLDPQGDTIPGATVTVAKGNWTRSVTSDSSGAFVVSGVPDGPLDLRAELAGFRTAHFTLTRGGGPPVQVMLEIAALTETVTVTSEPPRMKVEQKPKDELPSQAASQNVLNLQRRVSGVLPVRVDVPRSGRSYVLIRPLVLDEPTTVEFEYKTR